MKLISTLCLVLFLMISSLSFSQRNIQTGYDFGSFRIPDTGQKNFNTVHRLNLTGEYKFHSNFLISLNLGYDLHKINYNFSYSLNHPTGIGSYKFIFFSDIDIQTFRTGLSVGYNLEVGDVSSLQFRFTYDLYFINNISIKALTKEERFYYVSSDQIDESQPVSTKVEHDPDLIDLEKIGFGHRNFILSLHYKYEIKNYFISPHIAFSPWNRGFILSEGQNLYLAGIRLGYTFPQNSEKDEK